jgi:hypothetical protein
MSLIYHVRESVIQQLYNNYVQAFDHIQKVIQFFPEKIVLDHFAVIDLPSEKSGIFVLNQIFSSLGYLPQGRDYLQDKQNEFMWLAPMEANSKKATEVSPQIVIADFCLDDLSPKVKNIIMKYTRHFSIFPWREFHRLVGEAYHDNHHAASLLIKMIVHYCQQRETVPTVQDYLIVKEQNELLSWVLAFGRGINHFGINIGLLNQYAHFSQFNACLSEKLNIRLNQKNGLIKGDEDKYIAQSSTAGDEITLPLLGGEIKLLSPFVEFIWRAKKVAHPLYWNDYYTGFIGMQADDVIESVYAPEKK